MSRSGRFLKINSPFGDQKRSRKGRFIFSALFCGRQLVCLGRLFCYKPQAIGLQASIDQVLVRQAQGAKQLRPCSSTILPCQQLVCVGSFWYKCYDRRYTRFLRSGFCLANAKHAAVTVLFLRLSPNCREADSICILIPLQTALWRMLSLWYRSRLSAEIFLCCKWH